MAIGMDYDDVRKRLKNYDKQDTPNTKLKQNLMNALIRQAGYRESQDAKNPDKGVMNELSKELMSQQRGSVKMYAQSVDARYGRGRGNKNGGFGSGYTFYCPTCEGVAFRVTKQADVWTCDKCGSICEGKKRFSVAP